MKTINVMALSMFFAAASWVIFVHADRYSVAALGLAAVAVATVKRG